MRSRHAGGWADDGGSFLQGPEEADELAGGAAGRLVAEAVGDDPVPDPDIWLS